MKNIRILTWGVSFSQFLPVTGLAVCMNNFSELERARRIGPGPEVDEAACAPRRSAGVARALGPRPVEGVWAWRTNHASLFPPLIPAHTLALSPLSFLSSFLLAAAARHRHRRVVETCNASRCLPSACLPACWARTTDAREAGGRTTAEARAGRDWRTRGRERRRERLSEARKSDECSIRGGGVKDEHGQQPVGDGVD